MGNIEDFPNRVTLRNWNIWVATGHSVYSERSESSTRSQVFKLQVLTATANFLSNGVLGFKIIAEAGHVAFWWRAELLLLWRLKCGGFS